MINFIRWLCIKLLERRKINYNYCIVIFDHKAKDGENKLTIQHNHKEEIYIRKYVISQMVMELEEVTRKIQARN